MTGAQASRKTRTRARLADIARVAGVSIATVDRVFNERESVSDAARERVIQVAREMGVRRDLPEAYRPITHLDLILPKNDSPFFVRLRAAFRDGIAMLDRGIAMHRHILAVEDTASFVRLISETSYARQGMILAVPDRPEIRAAVQSIQAAGQKVVTIVTDLPGLAGADYLGIDNRQAGATAAHLLGRSCRQSGRVAVLGAHHDWAGHVERMGGFQTTLSRDFPHLHCEIIEMDTRDDPDRCARSLRAALSFGPLVGVYNTGAGSIGIMNALKGAMPRPFWIGHELSDDHIIYLKDGTMDYAIDQNPRGQALGSLQTLLYRCGLITSTPALSHAELRIYTRENLPARNYEESSQLSLD